MRSPSSMRAPPWLVCFCVFSVLLASASLRADDHVAMPDSAPPKLIVIGFMGGRVRVGDPAHRETVVARELEASHPLNVDVRMFANHDGDDALRTLLRLLDQDRDGRLTYVEKQKARIVIFGHSWGGSETVQLARRLDALDVPVLLTIQVDSVQKTREDDRLISSNVAQAINFYQAEGLLRGRHRIVAENPARTEVLGNFKFTYRGHPIPCDGYPWFARAFMKSHIEIENDPVVWDRIEALILTKLPGASTAAQGPMQPVTQVRGPNTHQRPSAGACLDGDFAGTM